MNAMPAHRRDRYAVPLPDELHVEQASAGHEPCDEACAKQFLRGDQARCRHLRTIEDYMRSR
jgi:hypothetical protein